MRRRHAATFTNGNIQASVLCIYKNANQCSGEAYLMHLPLFEQVYNSADSTGSITFDALSTLSNTRMDQSVSQNPYYFRAFVGAFIPPGTHAIMYRMLANHTGPTPDGILSQSTLKSFYSVAGTSSSNFVYTPGHERIPENWYKRAPGSEYSVPGFVADVVMIDAQHPQGASFGGNTGTVNSFVGLNVTDLTVSLSHNQRTKTKTLAPVHAPPSLLPSASRLCIIVSIY